MATLEPQKFVARNGRELVFRHLSPDDAEAFLKFRNQVPNDSTHTMQYVGMTFPSVEETEKRLKFQKEDPLILNVGVFDGGQVVGYLNFRVPFHDHPWVNHLAHFGMMVLKEWWGQGVGKKLLELQDTHAKALGIQRIEAMVRVNNERGVTLYERNGFEIEGTRKKAAKIDGNFVDEYFIAKVFSDESHQWTPPTLETERLILRPLKLEDAEAIFEYAQNANVTKYTMWEPHKSVNDSLDYIKDYAFNYYRKGVPEPLGITFKKAPNKVIGTVGCFWAKKASRGMELAYAISEEHWGKGIVAEASLAVMSYCFKEFQLKRIQAHCKADNKASARVMEKIGMSFEGTLRSSIFHRNQFWDMHCYAKVN